MKLLQNTTLITRNGTMPIGIGFINWGADLSTAIPLIEKFKPAAVWFFAPSSPSSLQDWTSKTRKASPETKIWVQVGSVKEALGVMQNVEPDVLVVQGTDAGGHGLAHGASLITLLPEIQDTMVSNNRPILIAAGGIADARGASASFLLGASGVVMGTRFLACPEANIPRGYQNEILRASDGGQTTVRTKVYDTLRGTTGWAESHNARGIVNRSYFDAVGGMDVDENKRLYQEEMGKGDEGWGEEARMTAYAGSAVGLVKRVEGAGEIVKEVREGARDLLGGARALL
jgi:nitronate monooxygenase